MATTKIGEDDQKKRTLDALERRFAQAEAQLLQQQNKSKGKSIRPPPFDYKKPKITNSISSPIPLPISNPSATASLTNPSPRKDLEANEPTYSLLSHPIHENLASTSYKISDRKGIIADKILHELLQKGDLAHKYMQGSRGKKIDNWILLDNFVQGQGTNSDARIKALKSLSKRSKKHMSMMQHKKVGSLNLPADCHKFETFKPMHEIWLSYTTQLVKNVGCSE